RDRRGWPRADVRRARRRRPRDPRTDSALNLNVSADAAAAPAIVDRVHVGRRQGRRPDRNLVELALEDDLRGRAADAIGAEGDRGERGRERAGRGTERPAVQEERGRRRALREADEAPG